MFLYRRTAESSKGEAKNRTHFVNFVPYVANSAFSSLCHVHY